MKTTLNLTKTEAAELRGFLGKWRRSQLPKSLDSVYMKLNAMCDKGLIDYVEPGHVMPELEPWN